MDFLCKIRLGLATYFGDGYDVLWALRAKEHLDNADRRRVCVDFVKRIAKDVVPYPSAAEEAIMLVDCGKHDPAFAERFRKAKLASASIRFSQDAQKGQASVLQAEEQVLLAGYPPNDALQLIHDQDARATRNGARSNESDNMCWFLSRLRKNSTIEPQLDPKWLEMCRAKGSKWMVGVGSK